MSAFQGNRIERPRYAMALGVPGTTSVLVIADQLDDLGSIVAPLASLGYRGVAVASSEARAIMRAFRFQLILVAGTLNESLDLMGRYIETQRLDVGAIVAMVLRNVSAATDRR